jgi:hypothetical protein
MGKSIISAAGAAVGLEELLGDMGAATQDTGASLDQELSSLEGMLQGNAPENAPAVVVDKLPKRKGTSASKKGKGKKDAAPTVDEALAELESLPAPGPVAPQALTTPQPEPVDLLAALEDLDAPVVQDVPSEPVAAAPAPVVAQPLPTPEASDADPLDDLLASLPQVQETVAAAPAPQPVAAPAPQPEPEPVAAAPAPVAAPAPAADKPKGFPEKEGREPLPRKRVFWGRDKIGRLEAGLGPNLAQMLLLDVADAELTGEALAAKVAENRAMFKTLAVKVQNRATNIIELCARKTNRINPATDMVIRLLSKDGFLTTGDKGNMHTRMCASGYKPDAARAMGNSTLGMLRALKIVTGTDKGRYEPNQDSAILALLSERLSLNFIDREAALADAEKREAQEREAFKLKKLQKLGLEPETPAAPAPIEQAQETVQPETPAAEALNGLLDDLNAASTDKKLGELDQLEAALF